MCLSQENFNFAITIQAMSTLIKINDDYAKWVSSLSQRFRQSQIKAAVKVNSELLKFYWSLGHDIVEMHAESKWGDKFMESLSADLKDALPYAKGFSPTNLLYMKNFYTLYKPLLNTPQLGEQFENPDKNSSNSHNLVTTPQVGDKLQQAESKIQNDIFRLPWGHHKLLIDKFKRTLNSEKAIFYVHQAVENDWSRAVLLNFLDTNLYDRQGKAITNFSSTLPSPASDLASELLKDPYTFDFLDRTKEYKEQELKDVMIDNITKFLVELGKGFAYMGREYRLQVSTKEQFIDLLFYQTNLHCHVVIEVKVTDFEPSYLGQLGAYVSFVNHLLKKDGDNPTIGLLICKNKDNVFARYSLEAYNTPMGISEFEGVKLLPDGFKSSLPSIEDIENELKD
jgi:predicted nuclease of restriction endonuclease-like (RecB) superfamily